MKPIEVFTRNWGVEDDGLLIVSGLRAKASAEDWIKEYRETIRHYSAAMETPDVDGEAPR